MIDPDAALDYLGFVEARHQVWERRQRGEPAPWTDNPIVRAKKFTNVFRVLDYGSQFVLTDLVDVELDDRDQLMRLFLYRHTGRVEAWKHVLADLGEYPTTKNLPDVLESMKDYRGGTTVVTSGTTTVGGGSRKGNLFDRPIFTGAYLVFPQSQVPGTDKLESIFDLTHRLFVSGSRVSHDFFNARSQSDRFAALRTNKGVADFMSMQILTDWGYTPHCGEDRENNFVIAGPGARKGAQALDPTGDVSHTLRWAAEAVEASPPLLPLDSYGEHYRAPSLMDIQNTLCEFSKYVRFASKPTTGKQYVPAHPELPSAPVVLPGHW